MNIRVLSKAYEAIEPLAFHRVIPLLRTDRDHEQKLVLPRLFALVLVSVSTIIGFLDLLKVSILSQLKSLMLSMCIFLAKFHAPLLSQSACREVSSSVRSSKPDARGFRS